MYLIIIHLALRTGWARSRSRLCREGSTKSLHVALELCIGRALDERVSHQKKQKKKKKCMLQGTPLARVGDGSSHWFWSICVQNQALVGCHGKPNRSAPSTVKTYKGETATCFEVQKRRGLGGSGAGGGRDLLPHKELRWDWILKSLCCAVMAYVCIFM